MIFEENHYTYMLSNLSSIAAKASETSNQVGFLVGGNIIFADLIPNDDERFTPEPMPQKPAGKAKLTADQKAAIEAAGIAITSPRPPKPKPAAPVDLSSLDDIEGI